MCVFCPSVCHSSVLLGFCWMAARLPVSVCCSCAIALVLLLVPSGCS
jgi:hypothetical protein